MSANGLLNIHKPAGFTSFQIVKAVKKILHEKKVGHCGTLDPMATGVLLVLFGSMTSASDELAAGEKVYHVWMQYGIRTDTGDITGKIVETSEIRTVASQEILKVFEKFTGELDQIPPMYSALKWGGRRLYEYARQGVEVFRYPRKVTVFSLNLLSIHEPLVEFQVVCSKGTYVRSLVEEIGKSLGMAATLRSLVREKVGPFSIEDSLDWNDLLRMGRDELLSKSVSTTFIRS